MHRKFLSTAILTIAFLCVGCSRQNTPQGASDTQGIADISHTKSTAVTEQIALSTNANDYFTDRDMDSTFDRNAVISIQLTGSTATSSSDTVQINGSTITITTEGTYLLSGTLDNGMLVVNTDKSHKVQLILDSVNIFNDTCAPIYIKQADKVFLTLADGSLNELSNGGTFTAIDENTIDAVIFSKDDLTINGSGSLIITSPGGHGIVSKDALTITGGTFRLNTASHGLAGKDNLCISNATFSITSGKDGLHAENADDTSLGYIYIDSGSFQIVSEGDGISSSGEMLIQDGTFTIAAGGGSVNAAQKISDFRDTIPNGNHGNNHGPEHGGLPGDFGNMEIPQRPPGDFGDTEIPEASPRDFGDTKIPEASPGAFGNIGDNTTISEDSASQKGIKASSNLQINGGSFQIDTADDAIHSNANLIVNHGAFDLKTGDDGFHADASLTILAGNIMISECYEGLEGLCIDIWGGTISLTASDDGLNAAGGNDQSDARGPHGGDIFATDENSYINIAGGSLYINAAGDGMDSNGYLSMSDGYVVVSGPNRGDTAILDYGIEATISGGIFIGTGAAQMSTNFSTSSTQGALLVNCGNQTAGTVVTLSDVSGQNLISRETDLDFSGLLFSCPSLKQNEIYTLTIGSDSMEFTMNKLVYNTRTN